MKHYVELLGKSGQIERVHRESGTRTVDGAFYFLAGLIVGLGLAWLLQ